MMLGGFCGALPQQLLLCGLGFARAQSLAEGLCTCAYANIKSRRHARSRTRTHEHRRHESNHLWRRRTHRVDTEDKKTHHACATATHTQSERTNEQASLPLFLGLGVRARPASRTPRARAAPAAPHSVSARPRARPPAPPRALRPATRARAAAPRRARPAAQSSDRAQRPVSPPAPPAPAWVAVGSCKHSAAPRQ